ncbi:hypothetical protein [Aquimarina celericrescens]|uniref:Uncharacterized protein n=1 Tax=Aquimarina celericrescens TaxID=1964542 RepID=A0ABW5B171_9FLAO|nr:hypothetical protein [Aquimarina celericrescens]
MKKEIQIQEKSLQKKKQRISKRITKLKDIIAKVEDRFFEGLIDSETFKNSKIRYAKKIKVFENEILRLKNFNPVFEFQSRM